MRGKLWTMWTAALDEYRDPIKAWASIVEDKEKSATYKKARGKGGHVRVDWKAASQLISAQLIYTIQKYGPDRIAGFTPIPAMSMIRCVVQSGSFRSIRCRHHALFLHNNFIQFKNMVQVGLQVLHRFRPCR